MPDNASHKMITLVQERVGTILPDSVQGESVLQDETGYVFLKLAISVERDIITAAGYYASEEITIDAAAAMAAVTQLLRGRAIMSAALLSGKDIEAFLDFDETACRENEKAIRIAEMMLKECLRNYSMQYNLARKKRLEQRSGNGS